MDLLAPHLQHAQVALLGAPCHWVLHWVQVLYYLYCDDSEAGRIYQAGGAA
jgi:hypothetical protein